MKSKQVYYSTLGAIGLLIIGLIGGAYGANKLLAAQSKQLVSNRLQADVLTAEQNQVIQAKQDIKKYQGLATIAQSVVPQDKDQAEAIRQIVDIAAAHGVSLSSITFPASTLGATSGTPVNSGLSQLTAVPGISGVYSLQLTVQSDATNPVPYSKFIDFLSALEQNRRTALVNSITLQPNDKDRSTLSFGLVLEEYIKP